MALRAVTRAAHRVLTQNKNSFPHSLHRNAFWSRALRAATTQGEARTLWVEAQTPRSLTCE
jgi:hypothetical protein